MTRVYPTQVSFLIADVIRLELGGKVTLAGLYSGDQLLLEGELPKELPDNAVALALGGLSILIVLKGGDGRFPTSFAIDRPSGEPLGIQGALDEITLAKGQTHNLVLPIVPFPVFEFGQYILRLKLNKRTYEHKFVIRHCDPKVRIPRSVTKPPTSASAQPTASAVKKRKRTAKS
jgi:hypothetical protein